MERDNPTNTGNTNETTNSPEGDNIARNDGQWSDLQDMKMQRAKHARRPETSEEADSRPTDQEPQPDRRNELTPDQQAAIDYLYGADDLETDIGDRANPDPISQTPQNPHTGPSGTTVMPRIDQPTVGQPGTWRSPSRSSEREGAERSFGTAIKGKIANLKEKMAAAKQPEFKNTMDPYSLHQKRLERERQVQKRDAKRQRQLEQKRREAANTSTSGNGNTYVPPSVGGAGPTPRPPLVSSPGFMHGPGFGGPGMPPGGPGFGPGPGGPGGHLGGPGFGPAPGAGGPPGGPHP